MYHAIVVCLSVEEGDGGWESELADYVEGEIFDEGWCGAIASFNRILFGGDRFDGVGLFL